MAVFRGAATPSFVLGDNMRNVNWLWVVVLVLAAIALIIFIVNNVNVNGGK